MHLLPHFVVPKADKPETSFLEPFWAVRRVPANSDEAQAANCVMSSVPVSAASVVGATDAVQRLATRTSVQVPIMVNSRAIAAEEELVYADPTMEVKKKAQTAVFHKETQCKSRGRGA